MDVDTQCELIRSFMLAIAPQVTLHSLEAGSDAGENASVTLEWSMQLCARFSQLHETLTAPPENGTPADIEKASKPAPGLRQAQARIPIAKSEVPDMRGQEERRRSSPLSPDWKPPSPYS